MRNVWYTILAAAVLLFNSLTLFPTELFVLLHGRVTFGDLNTDPLMTYK